MDKILSVVFCCIVILLSGCGGEEGNGPSSTFPDNPGPVTIGADQRGLPLELYRSNLSNRAKYNTHASQVGALFLYEQIWSEYLQATEGRIDAAKLDVRIEDLFENFDQEIALFDDHYLVVDLQRRDRQWLVDWTGGVRDEPENREESMTFTRRDDYWVEVQARLERAVIRSSPTGLILGMEMNLYYDQNPGDWGNFIDFFWTMADAVKGVDPEIRVAAGINWIHFMEHQVEPFRRDGESLTDVEPVRRAYQAILDPLVNRQDGDGNVVGQSDFVALAAIPDPADFDNTPSQVSDWHFAGLRLLFPEGSKAIVWFQLGWPISSTGSSAPGQFYQRFLELAGGTTIERVCWYGLTNLLAADCQPLTGEAVGASQTVCNRGLFSVTGAPTSLSDSYFAGE
ncbi:MAG: hypothetical protein JW797_16345 [Bradymonadales bacterium]|nr:hypothetical protein [Bradymonadales bacterium]